MKLNQELIKSKFVYFVGAGFSKILNYPLMNEFVDNCLTDDLPDRSKLIIEFIKKTTGSNDLENILSSLQKIIDTKYSFKIDSVVNYALELMNKPTSDKISKSNKYQIPSNALINPIIDNDSIIVQDIEYNTISKIKKKIFQTYRPRNRVDYSILKYFFNPLISSVSENTIIPIFTTNYDNVIEEYFKRSKAKFKISNSFNNNNIFDPDELLKIGYYSGVNPLSI